MAALPGVPQCIFSCNYCLKHQSTFLFSSEHCQDGQNHPRLSLMNHKEDDFSFNYITCGSVPSDSAVVWSCVAWWCVAVPSSCCLGSAGDDTAALL